MNYKLDTSNSSQHYLNIEFRAKVSGKKTTLQLPAWRPGRYELGNFAKNIQQFNVTDENGKDLKFSKQTKDSWVVDSTKAKEIVVKYNYYSIDFNAGSTYLDEDTLYVNPVNCFIYIPGRENDKCTVEIPKEKGQKIACGVPYKSGKIKTNNFHELVDTPFVVSSLLQSKLYDSKGVDFTVWFYGECKPDWKKVITDFKKFTDYQMKLFGGFPAKEYHFINIIHPHKAYHGVEHVTSTVIVLGPSYEVMKERYVDLLGVSSHELYHAWNIKTIRPAEMNPYDYTKENYSKLGYVCEGVTTYMGDLILHESGVFDKTRYLIELNQYLKRHYDNGGRLNLSVADSSYDTWLNGYQMGVPDRKSSIYVEGSLVSFMIDMKIRETTNHKKSLHTVMKDLYVNFGKKGIGYTEEDYKSCIEKHSGVSFTSFFNNYIWGTKEFTNELKKAFDFGGYKLAKFTSENPSDWYGLKLTVENGANKVVHVEKDSAGYIAGFSRGDELLTINNLPIKENVDRWLEYFKEDNIEINYLRNNKIWKTSLNKANKNQFYSYKVALK